mmetsp:Transcript_31711/g.79740  ORF Transcript_31711/g.79740 Transcript_31711/m.79740 type:complete len:309 (+) Transcript_31711:69-995(+)
MQLLRRLGIGPLTVVLILSTLATLIGLCAAEEEASDHEPRFYPKLDGTRQRVRRRVLMRERERLHKHRPAAPRAQRHAAKPTERPRPALALQLADYLWTLGGRGAIDDIPEAFRIIPGSSCKRKEDGKNNCDKSRGAVDCVKDEDGKKFRCQCGGEALPYKGACRRLADFLPVTENKSTAEPVSEEEQLDRFRVIPESSCTINKKDGSNNCKKKRGAVDCVQQEHETTFRCKCGEDSLAYDEKCRPLHPTTTTTALPANFNQPPGGGNGNAAVDGGAAAELGLEALGLVALGIREAWGAEAPRGRGPP